MPENPVTDIPPELLARLVEHREAIAANGSIQRRGEPDRRPSFRLRFRGTASQGGPHRQLSIGLGSGQIVPAVRALIESWQRQRLQMRQAQRQAELMRRAQARHERQQRQQRRRMVLALAGGGRRRRRRIGRDYEAACRQGAQAELAWCLAQRYEQPNPRGGRPRQRRLILPTLPLSPGYARSASADVAPGPAMVVPSSQEVSR